MIRKIGTMMLMAGMVSALTATSSLAAEKKTAKKQEKTESKKEQAALVNEGDYAKWLVQVLGLARFLPPTPTENECFAILLQNGVTPKDGWSAGRNVSKAVLARTVVQSMGKADEVKNKDSDQAWIDYLDGQGIEIGTIGEAVETLDPVDSPLAAEAVIVTTDPLAKVHKYRPVDEQQHGADIGTITRVFSQAGIEAPPPMTPN